MSTNHYYNEQGYYTRSAFANDASEPPKNATRIDLPPYSPESEVIRFDIDAQTWIVELSIVGTVYYNQDGTKGIISETNNAIPAGAIITPPPDETYLTHDGENWIQDESARKIKLRNTAKAVRDAWIESPILLFGVVWQIDARSRELMEKGIFTYEYMEDTGTPIPNAQPWILDDNSVRVTTYEELRALLVTQAQRTQDVYRQFNEWSLAGMIGDFIIDDSQFPNPY